MLTLGRYKMFIKLSMTSMVIKGHISLILYQNLSGFVKNSNEC